MVELVRVGTFPGLLRQIQFEKKKTTDDRRRCVDVTHIGRGRAEAAEDNTIGGSRGTTVLEPTAVTFRNEMANGLMSGNHQLDAANTSHNTPTSTPPISEIPQ